LNTQNGGFTVFGKLVGAQDQQVVNRLASFPIKNEGAPFDSIPLSGYSGSHFPTDTTAGNYALIHNVTVVKRDEFLSYSVVSNNNQSLVTASIDNNRLTLHYAANQSGTAQITVRATDRFGASVEASFHVAVA